MGSVPGRGGELLGKKTIRHKLPSQLTQSLAKSFVRKNFKNTFETLYSTLVE